MAAEEVAQELETLAGPVINKLIAMMGAARNAFNRHSRGSMDELKDLQGGVEKDLKAAISRVEGLIAGKHEREQAGFHRLQSILTHEQLIADTIGALSNPIQKKIQDGVLFSDKAVSQTNYLFDHQAGILRSLVDIIKTDNEFLKKYVLEEGTKLIQACIVFATEHEARMIEGVCLPQAAPIFLAILDRMRSIGQHAVDIANLLAKKP